MFGKSVKVLLHVKHRSINELKDNDNVTWSSVYIYHLDMINNDPTDLLGQPIDNEDDIVDEDSFDEFTEDEELEEFRYDWIILAKMSPNMNRK